MSLSFLVARFKIFFGNAGAYISILNFILLVTTNIMLLRDKGIVINIPLAVILCFVLVIVIGYLDYKYILYPQAVLINRKNDIMIKLEKIEKDIERLKQ